MIVGFDECGPHKKLKTFSVWDLRVAMKPLFDTDCILDGEKIFKL